MKISEIFLSIDGEGIRTGYPVIFIRTHGCILNCSYCDSMYAVTGTDYTHMTVNQILETIRRWQWCKRVTITGGEPLIQPDMLELITKLRQDEYEVNVETCGAVRIDKLRAQPVSASCGKLIVTMDWKSLSSCMADRMISANLDALCHQDVLKFVVGSRDDLDQMRSLLSDHSIVCNVFVSPIFGTIEPKEIVEYLLEHELHNCRVQLQLHKFIWDPQLRGV